MKYPTTVYNKHGYPVKLGANDFFGELDSKFFVTSAVVAAGTVGVLIFLAKKKKRKK